ncbi:MAG: tripartite tricarboxylate transporter substrate binding protein [Betaproteobacteria bacterium]|nr:tripartite tricarboxylate transporter substrate binding protein [Betaproteobacteria bacterium]
MENKPVKTAILLLGLSGALSHSGAGGAQQYPARPIRLVVGFAAGGATDVSARTIAHKLSETIGQQVIVDNRPGASGNLAADLVVRSAPDGYTLFLANATLAMPSLFAKLPFDVKKDLVPVSLVGYGPLLLSVHPSLPVKSVKDLIALAKRKPGMLDYATAGVGSMTHLGMALFISMANVRMVHVPYRGGAPSAVAVMTGEAQLTFSSVAAALAPVRQGKLRPVAVSSARRSAALPDVPTVSEGGLPGYDASSWYGFLGPGSTPQPIISKLGDETAKALGAADLRQRLVNQGIEPANGGVEEFARYLNAEIAKWAKVIRDAGIPPQ